MARKVAWGAYMNMPKPRQMHVCFDRAEAEAKMDKYANSGKYTAVSLAPDYHPITRKHIGWVVYATKCEAGKTCSSPQVHVTEPKVR